jgi:hypothetical protein
MSALPLGLPVPCARQTGHKSKVKPGKWIQGSPQPPNRGSFLSHLFADGSKNRAHSWGFRVGGFEETLKAASFRKQRYGSGDGFFWREFARLSSPSEEVKQCGIGL